MIAERIRTLREKNDLTQSALAKKLNITRSSVNAWEMGISVPSTFYLVELASIFNVSTDFLLGIEKTTTVSVTGLLDEDIQLVYEVINHLRKKNETDLNDL